MSDRIKINMKKTIILTAILTLVFSAGKAMAVDAGQSSAEIDQVIMNQVDQEAKKIIETSISEVSRKSDKSILVNFEIKNKSEWNLAGISYEIVIGKMYNNESATLASKEIKEASPLQTLQTIKKEILFEGDFEINKGRYVVVLNVYNGKELFESVNKTLDVAEGEVTMKMPLIQSSSKVITLDGKAYSAFELAKVNPGEKVVLQIETEPALMQYFDKTKGMDAKIDVYAENVMGQKIETLATKASISKDGKSFLLTLTAPTKPGVYENVVQFLFSTGKQASSIASMRYVVAGDKAVILNASLDKISYQKGETAKVLLKIAKDLLATGKIDGKVEISSEEVICGTKEITNEKENGTIEIMTEVPMENGCLNPKVKVSLSKDGTILDSQEFFYNNLKKAEEPKKSREINFKKLLTVIFSFIIIVVAIILIGKIIRRKRNLI